MSTAYIWFLAAIVCFLAEAVGITGVGFFFAAISAFCVGMLIEMDYLAAEDLLMQGSAFFVFTAFWALVLWKPMQKIRSGKTESHNDMIGRTATVDAAGLQKGATGNARWSGTTMRARLADDASVAEAVEGTELKIIAVDGSTLILAQKDYVQPEKE